MSYLPELRASLVRAADRQRDAPVLMSRRRGRLPWLGPAFATGVTIAVAAVAIVLVGHRGHIPASGSAGRGPAYHLTVPPVPPSPNPTSAQWSLIQGAHRATVARDPECSSSAALPHFVPGAPGPALTSILGVLRRPATAADAAPLPYLQHSPGIYKSAIRPARRVDGDGLYIVPTANVLGLRTVPRRCLSLEADALRRQAKGDAAATVAAALLAQRTFLTWQQYEARHPEGVCLAEVDRDRAGSFGCGWGVGEIEEGQAGLGGSDLPPLFFHGIVPDGVASVVLELPRHLGSVTAKVLHNVFIASLPRTVQAPVRIVWRGADGAVIKTTRVP